MNFISTFEELDKLYESVSTEEPLTEGKIIDGLKKVGTRLKADVSTIVRSFAELSGSDALYDLAAHVENKAVLKALQSGNAKVLNTLTVEDIEELKDDIKAYEAAKNAKKKAKKSGVKEQLAEGLYTNEWELCNAQGLKVVDQTFGSKEEALAYANKYNIDNATQLIHTELLNGKYNGHYTYNISNKKGYFVIEEACGKNLQEDSDIDIEIVDDPTEEQAEEVPKQLILECDKCGALVIKDESSLTIDEESGLANVDESCTFCEEAAGYKIVGVVTPYEATEANDEELEEVLDFNVPVNIPVNVTANDNNVAVGGIN